MAESDPNKLKIAVDPEEQKKYLEQCQENEDASYRWLSTLRPGWDDKESMLLGTRPEDALSKRTKSKVFNPVLATQVLERSSRVMAQTPTGEAFAVSEDDVGKNLLMNMLLKYFPKHANEEGSFLLKLRQTNAYSHIYGSMFGLVPWRINRINGYIGPEFLNIGMRDARPQPGRKTVDKSDQFGVRSVVSLAWLKKQDPQIWMNVDKIEAEMKQGKDAGASGESTAEETKSYVERQRFPSQIGDTSFPDIEIFTEYRHEMWITWAQRFKKNDKSHPYILRVVKNAYPKGYLPIVAKHAFPLIDSIIGLGDFERGKTLQFAMNSLINLFLDGVKYSIFPPLHINLDEVDPTSILWGAGNKWYMKSPNVSVQPMKTNSSEWMGTFQSTFGFMSGAIQNLVSGASQSSQADGEGPTLGKTPDAIKQYSLSQSSRDEWDRFMMEDTVKQVYERWIALLTTKLEVPIVIRTFGAELQDIQREYPQENILSIFKSKNRGNVSIDKSLLNDDMKDKDGKDLEDWEPTRYDFDLESGSTMATPPADEGEAASSMIKDFTDAPQLLAEIQKRGKDIDFAELYKRRLIGEGVKDWNKIIIDGPVGGEQMTDDQGNIITEQGNTLMEQSIAPGQEGSVLPENSPAPAPSTAPLPPQAPEATAPGANGFKDPALANVAAQALQGGQSG